MGQINEHLRNIEDGIGHWCPGCEEMHIIPNTWNFDSNFDIPTFSPSVRITGKQKILVEGKWAGGWVRDAEGNALDFCCHYFLIQGQLQFCGDSTHDLAGRTVPLPSLPPHLRDDQ